MLKKLTPQDKLAAELEKIIREAQNVLSQYRAATARKQEDSRPFIFKHPRTGKRVIFKKG